MAEYTGANLRVKFNNEELPQVRMVRINAEGAGVDREDVTHAGDTTMQFKDKIPNPGREIATISALDEAGASGYYRSLAGQITPGTLVIYPEGTATGKPTKTATGRMMPPTFEHGYDTVNTVELTFITDEASGFKFTNGVVQ